jgi:hypothetical protein
MYVRKRVVNIVRTVMGFGVESIVKVVISFNLKI